MDRDPFKAELDRRRPLRDQIYGLVRTMILTGEIKPGETIDEKAIAARLQISRTPVREAVKKLSDENLIEVKAQSRTRAAPIDRKAIEESYIIRRALEVESACQASLRMTRQHQDRLEDIVLSHQRAMERQDFIGAIDTDDVFHRYIAGISDLPLLWRTIEISKAQIDRCRHLMVPRTGQAEATLDQHRQIIAALASGDPEKAGSAMRAHLDAAYESTIQVLDGPGLI